MLNRVADTLKSVAVIVSFLLVLALILIVVSHIIWPTPMIEAVSIPNSVQKWGYTADFFAQKVSDGTHVIALNAKRDFDEAYPRHWIGTQTIEAKIPGSDFTIKSAAQFISDILSFPSKQITGVVTKIDNEFDISFKVSGGEYLVAKVTSTSDSADAEAIVRAGSELAMQLIYPYVLAASLYNDEKAGKSANFVRTISILDYMISNREDLYYAHNLKCNVFIQLYKIDLAEKQCKEAIAIDPANWPAQANLGYLYYSLAQKGFNPVAGGASIEAKENCEKAVEQFTKAEQSHHLKILYDSWARCLDVLGRQDEASQLRRRLENKS
jgi:tetratricopeptide (TPR) repeat protein